MAREKCQYIGNITLLIMPNDLALSKHLLEAQHQQEREIIIVRPPGLFRIMEEEALKYGVKVLINFPANYDEDDDY